jgi:hypothetical protein
MKKATTEQVEAVNARLVKGQGWIGYRNIGGGNQSKFLYYSFYRDNKQLFVNTRRTTQKTLTSNSSPHEIKPNAAFSFCHLRPHGSSTKTFGKSISETSPHAVRGNTELNLNTWTPSSTG